VTSRALRIRIPVAPRLEWDEVIADRMRWHPGEHVLIAGPTGCGKTTLAFSLLDARRYLVALATKPRDDLIDELPKRGVWRTTDWPTPSHHFRWVFAPSYSHPSQAQEVRAKCARVMADVFVRGGFTLYADELNFLGESPSVSALIRVMYHGARSSGVSLMASAQRPRYLPVAALGQSTHLFIFRTRDREDLRRLSGIGGMDSSEVMYNVANLPPGDGVEPSHDVLYINTRTARSFVTRAPEVT
jgi:DNA polymerase III delta prime subunit